MREYEIISEVTEQRASQSQDYYLLRRTELASALNLRSIPTSSPALAGYVYVQDRKKKWSKRWLELRDHSLFHSKSDSGKDEEHICTMSSFDVYLIQTPMQKFPKAHAFAIRSQDKISMFEKPDQDYVHFFCLSDPAAHRDWVKNILNARTYVLRQERAQLFKFPPPVTNSSPAPVSTISANAPSSDAAAPLLGSSSLGLLSRNTSLSRRAVSRTHHAAPSLPSSSDSMPNTKPLLGADLFAGPFEKGSLLADIVSHRTGSTGDTHTKVPVNGDLSQHQRTRDRLEEHSRRIERQQKAAAVVANGGHLVDLLDSSH